MITKTLKVIEIIDGYRIVINAGTRDNIKEGQSYLIYEKGHELIDPDTNESLGILEIVKGKGVVVYVQDKIATIKSTSFKNRKKQISSNIMSALGNTFIEEESLPFDNPQIGDFAKKI